MKSVQISLRSYRVLLKLSASLPSTTFSTGVYKVPIFQQQRPRVDHYASLSYIMMTWGKELPTVRIILEDGTLAKKGFLFSFRNYDGPPKRKVPAKRVDACTRSTKKTNTWKGDEFIKGN